MSPAIGAPAYVLLMISPTSSEAALGYAEDRLAPLSREQLRRLVNLSAAFNSSVDLDELLPRILEVMLRTMDAEAGWLWTAQPDGLRCEAAAGPEAARALVGVALPAGAGVAGDAVERRAAALLPDVTRDARFLPQLDELTGFTTRSVIAVPLVTREQIVGAIEVANPGDGRFDEDEVAFLVALADDAAAALRNAQLLDAERQARDLKALLSFSHEISATFDLDRIAVLIVNLAAGAIPYKRCAIALWEDDRLRVRALSGQEQADSRSSPVRQIERFLAWVAERGEAVWIPDVGDDEDEDAIRVREKLPQYLEDAQAGEILALPIRDAEGLIGMLLFEFHGRDSLGEWGREAAQLVANESALALRNAQLYAGVPFISFLEPLARRRRRLAALPRRARVAYALAAALALGTLVVARIPVRIPGESASVRAAVQRPFRAGISGVLDEISVREGQRVSAGTRLGHLRDEDLQQRVTQSRSALDVAQREALTADAEGDSRAAALARLHATEATEALRLYRLEERRAAITAPTSGVVLTQRIEERLGSYYEAGTPIGWIGDPDWIEIELEVSQADIGAIALGDRVRARVYAYPGTTFQGRVAAIAPMAGRGESGPVYTVRAILDNRRHLLRPGMDASARVLGRSRPVVAVVFRRPWRWLRMNLWWKLPL